MLFQFIIIVAFTIMEIYPSACLGAFSLMFSWVICIRKDLITVNDNLIDIKYAIETNNLKECVDRLKNYEPKSQQ